MGLLQFRSCCADDYITCYGDRSNFKNESLNMFYYLLLYNAVMEHFSLIILFLSNCVLCCYLVSFKEKPQHLQPTLSSNKFRHMRLWKSVDAVLLMFM